MKTIKLTQEQIESAIAEKLADMQYEANKAKYQKRLDRMIKDMAKDNLQFGNGTRIMYMTKIDWDK